LSETVNVINISNYNNPKLSLKNGPRVEFGSGDYEIKVKMLAEVLADIQQRGKEAEVVDLRSGEARITF
jgi:cell division septal protein FtsQ